jgi:hypothetical protein
MAFEQGVRNMKTAIRSALAGAALLASAGAAGADDPVKLSDAQMDGVTASGFAVAVGQAFALGDFGSDTFATSSTFVDDNVFAAAQAHSGAAASSVFFFPAVAASRAEAAATLP